MKFNLFLIIGWSIIACSNQPSSFKESTPIERHPDFSNYWFAGVAELNHYKLSQARYGEQREGDVVLIFVTEDFLTQKQVKDEGAENEKSTSVLKTNYVKKFTTGIYDYSLMSSIFTPINENEYPQTLKVTTSSQEWCGHTYLQLNHRNNKFQYLGHSYFMNEGDKTGIIESTLLEDELFNRIRLNYNNIPTGEIEILPSTQWLSLSHTEMKPQKATLKIVTSDIDSNKMSLELKYNTIDRQLLIEFESNFPHKITSWTETFPSGYGNNRASMSTTAVLDTTILSPYWSKNSNSDEQMRKLMGLDKKR